MHLDFSFPVCVLESFPPKVILLEKAKEERKEQLPKSEGSVRFQKHQQPQRLTQITRWCGSAPELMASREPWRRKASGRPLDCPQGQLS